MRKRKKIELHSEEVSDILSLPPKWIISWGVSLIFTIVLILVTGSMFFRYPEIITAPITVSSGNMAVRLKARINGKLVSLLVKDSAKVGPNEPVAILETTTSYEDFIFLENSCNVFKEAIRKDSIPKQNLFRMSMQLGSIQPYFSSFIKSLDDYNNFMDADYHTKKISILNKQLKEQKSILVLGGSQLQDLNEQYLLAKAGFDRDSVLFEQKAISQADLEQSKIKRLSTRQSLDNIKGTVANMRHGILQSELSIFELNQDKNETQQQLKISLIGNFDNLSSQMEEWRQTYVLVSPVYGRISYSRYWQENQNVSAGDIVLVVIPEERAGVVGKIYLPLQGAGKVKLKQKVNIKLDNFPYMEYGMIEGRIRGMSSVPVEIDGVKVIALEIEFLNGLTSNYGIELNSGEEMSGIADIITENISLFQRLVNPIRHLFKSRII